MGACMARNGIYGALFVQYQVRSIEAKHPGDISKIIHLVKGDNYRKSFQETGDTESSVWSAGQVRSQQSVHGVVDPDWLCGCAWVCALSSRHQVMGLIDDIPTCEALVAGMVAEAEEIIRGRLASMVTK